MTEAGAQGALRQCSHIDNSCGLDASQNTGVARYSLCRPHKSQCEVVRTAGGNVQRDRSGTRGHVGGVVRLVNNFPQAHMIATFDGGF